MLSFVRTSSIIALAATSVVAEDVVVGKNAFVLLGPTGDNSIRDNGVWQGLYESWAGGVYDSSTLQIHPTMNTPHTEEELESLVMESLGPLYESLEANPEWTCEQPSGDCDPETFYDDMVVGNIDIQDGRDAVKQSDGMIPAMEGYDTIFVYMSIPPYTFGDWATATATAWGPDRVYVAAEKPFGDSTEGADMLYEQITVNLDESHLMLVDHWLGFFMVKNLPNFREVVTDCLGVVEWSSESFDKIVITEHETRGLQGRGAFFDGVGQVRDLIQSHLLQVLGNLLIDPDTEDQSKAKLDVFQNVSVRTCSHGQYDGFLYEPKLGYHADFADATFSTMFLDMDMEQWNETSLEITTGKDMGTTLYTIEMYQTGGPGKLTYDIGLEEVGVGGIKVSDWPLANGECSFTVPAPGFSNDKEMTMSSSTDVEGTGSTLVSYDPNSMYVPQAYAVMLSSMITGNYDGFVSFPEVNQSWIVITAGSPSICNDPPGGATLIYQNPEECDHTPPKVCYTGETVQDYYDCKFACTPDHDVEWKCLNFYQDKCGLEWDPPECAGWTPPMSDDLSEDITGGEVEASSDEDGLNHYHSGDLSSRDHAESDIGCGMDGGLKSIKEIACSTSYFSVMCESITAIDEEDMLSSGTGTYTAFFPTDEAFQKVDSFTSTLSDEQLLNVFLFHFLDGGAMMYEDLECKESIGMTNGQDSRTKCVGDEKYQKGQGNHETDTLPMIFSEVSNIMACNGVIHGLDGVMLPDDLPLEAMIGK